MANSTNSGLRSCCLRPGCHGSGNYQLSLDSSSELSCGHAAHAALSVAGELPKEYVVCMLCFPSLDDPRLQSTGRLAGRYTYTSGSHAAKVVEHFRREHSNVAGAFIAAPGAGAESEGEMTQGEMSQWRELCEALHELGESDPEPLHEGVEGSPQSVSDPFPVQCGAHMGVPITEADGREALSPVHVDQELLALSPEQVQMNLHAQLFRLKVFDGAAAPFHLDLGHAFCAQLPVIVPRGVENPIQSVIVGTSVVQVQEFQRVSPAPSICGCPPDNDLLMITFLSAPPATFGVEPVRQEVIVTLKSSPGIQRRGWTVWHLDFARKIEELELAGLLQLLNQAFADDPNPPGPGKRPSGDHSNDSTPAKQSRPTQSSRGRQQRQAALTSQQIAQEMWNIALRAVDSYRECMLDNPFQTLKWVQRCADALAALCGGLPEVDALMARLQHAEADLQQNLREAPRTDVLRDAVHTAEQRCCFFKRVCPEAYSLHQEHEEDLRQAVQEYNEWTESNAAQESVSLTSEVTADDKVVTGATSEGEQHIGGHVYVVQGVGHRMECMMYGVACPQTHDSMWEDGRLDLPTVLRLDSMQGNNQDLCQEDFETSTCDGTVCLMRPSPLLLARLLHGCELAKARLPFLLHIRRVPREGQPSGDVLELYKRGLGLLVEEICRSVEMLSGSHLAAPPLIVMACPTLRVEGSKQAETDVVRNFNRIATWAIARYAAAGRQCGADIVMHAQNPAYSYIQRLRSRWLTEEPGKYGMARLPPPLDAQMVWLAEESARKGLVWLLGSMASDVSWSQVLSDVAQTVLAGSALPSLTDLTEQQRAEWLTALVDSDLDLRDKFGSLSQLLEEEHACFERGECEQLPTLPRRLNDLLAKYPALRPGAPYSLLDALVASMPNSDIITHSCGAQIQEAFRAAGKTLDEIPPDQSHPPNTDGAWLLRMGGWVDRPESLGSQYEPLKSPLGGPMAKHVVVVGCFNSDPNFDAVAKDLTTVLEPSQAGLRRGTVVVREGQQETAGPWKGVFDTLELVSKGQPSSRQVAAFFDQVAVTASNVTLLGCVLNPTFG
eukprot:TRINITY_DN7311_c0_g1_i5.p1 TRINITY_DN7311_c0_g1~~TRINITY_DN7311_c0_g1_i5.p1  ORF type:complete len:1063 (-),score=123.77 TRINITY_DN7311_c0_g1_i5:208-3396(-)